jgi:DNA-binding LacI/PurR family transcriptional regulator
VSEATVSRVLNNQPHVADRTRQRVLTALRELEPPRRQTIQVGLIVPDANNPFFTQLAFDLDRECERRSATLILASSDGRADRELRLLDRFSNMKVDALFFVSAGTGQSRALARTIKRDFDLPLIALDRGLEGRDRIAVDSATGMADALQYLIHQGHTKIGYLKGLLGTETAMERHEAFEAAMSKHQLDIRPDWIFDGDFQATSGQRCADSLLATDLSAWPTALMTANDLMAIALVQHLQRAGVRVPSDLSIVGFDDIGFSSWVNPRLTTIAQPTQTLAVEAMNLLLSNMADAPRQSDEPRIVTLQPRLVIRDSVSIPRP